MGGNLSDFCGIIYRFLILQYHDFANLNHCDELCDIFSNPDICFNIDIDPVVQEVHELSQHLCSQGLGQVPVGHL